MENIEKQEKWDFRTTETLMSGILQEKFLKMEKMAQFSPVDAVFYTKSDNGVAFCYGMEIKTTPSQAYLTQGFILKVAKYISMLEWSAQKNCKVFIIYLALTDNHYYIYDVANITPSMKNLKNMSLKITQYDPNSPSILTPVLKLATSECVLHGSINPVTKIQPEK